MPKENVLQQASEAMTNMEKGKRNGEARQKHDDEVMQSRGVRSMAYYRKKEKNEEGNVPIF